MLVFISVASIKIRPIADYYCMASAAHNGILKSASGAYLNRGGELSVALVVFALVGKPLVSAPYSLASWLPFTLTLISIAIVGYILTLNFTSRFLSLRSVYNFILFSIFICLSWITHWWFPIVMEPDNLDRLRLANVMVFWQTVNMQYVLMPSLSIAIITLLIKNSKRLDYRLVIGLLFFCGIAIGFSGMVFAFSAFVVITFFLATKYVGSAFRIFDLLPGLFLNLGIALALFFSVLSPGTRSRAANLGELYKWTDGSLQGLIAWTFPFSIISWLETIFNWGSLAVFALGTLSFYILYTRGTPTKGNNSNLLVPTLFFFSLVLSIVSRVAETRAYPAFWHQMTAYLMSFLAIFLLGFLCGDRLINSKWWPSVSNWSLTMLMICTLVFVALVLFSTIEFSSAIETRYLNWNRMETIRNSNR